jgi:hypothetical protein
MEEWFMNRKIMMLAFAVSVGGLFIGSAAQAAVMIDVRPGNDQNYVNPHSNQTIPVAILGAADFDVQGVAISGLSLSAQGSATSATPKGNGHFVDVNKDGYKDIVLLFQIKDTGVKDGDTQLCLAGPGFQACDAITTTGQ